MTTPLAGAAIAQLEADGVATVIGTVVNPAGLTHAKTVPIRRISAFADPGLGASPVWHGFAIDRAGIAFTEAISVVGDQRMRIDLDALRAIGDGLAWAPGSFFDQDGNPIPSCARGTLARIESRLAARRPARRWSATRSSSCSSTPTGDRLPGQPVGAVRPGRRARARGLRPRRHRRGRRGRGRHRTVPSRVRRQPVRDLADPALAGGRRRPADPGPDHHRQGRPRTTGCGSACRRCRSPAAWVPVHTSTSHCIRR